MFFTITRSEATKFALENLHAWHWDPNFSAFAICKGLDFMTNEELEILLRDHVEVEEQQHGYEPGLLTCVRFKVVRDHELGKVCPCRHYSPA